MNYALLDKGVVKNIIWLKPENAIEFPNAVPMGDYPASVGDFYDGNYFYRNGKRVLTHIEDLSARLADAEAALALLGAKAEVD